MALEVFRRMDKDGSGELSADEAGFEGDFGRQLADCVANMIL